MNTKPTICIIGTGGTIAGAGTSATSANYESGQVDTSKLVNTIEIPKAYITFLLYK